MSEKTRICKTCAWGAMFDNSNFGICHFNPKPLEVNFKHWCRHWSETTGWDRFKKQPTQLEQAAAEILETVGNIAWGPLETDIKRWLEEYRKNC